MTRANEKSKANNAKSKTKGKKAKAKKKSNAKPSSTNANNKRSSSSRTVHTDSDDTDGDDNSDDDDDDDDGDDNSDNTSDHGSNNDNNNNDESSVSDSEQINVASVAAPLASSSSGIKSSKQASIDTIAIAATNVGNTDGKRQVASVPSTNSKPSNENGRIDIKSNASHLLSLSSVASAPNTITDSKSSNNKQPTKLNNNTAGSNDTKLKSSMMATPVAVTTTAITVSDKDKKTGQSSKASSGKPLLTASSVSTLPTSAKKSLTTPTATSSSSVSSTVSKHTSAMTSSNTSSGSIRSSSSSTVSYSSSSTSVATGKASSPSLLGSSHTSSKGPSSTSSSISSSISTSITPMTSRPSSSSSSPASSQVAASSSTLSSTTTTSDNKPNDPKKRSATTPTTATMTLSSSSPPSSSSSSSTTTSVRAKKPDTLTTNLSNNSNGASTNNSAASSTSTATLTSATTRANERSSSSSGIGVNSSNSNSGTLVAAATANGKGRGGARGAAAAAVAAAAAAAAASPPIMVPLSGEAAVAAAAAAASASRTGFQQPFAYGQFQGTYLPVAYPHVSSSVVKILSPHIMQGADGRPVYVGPAGSAPLLIQGTSPTSHANDTSPTTTPTSGSSGSGSVSDDKSNRPRSSNGSDRNQRMKTNDNTNRRSNDTRTNMNRTRTNDDNDAIQLLSIRAAEALIAALAAGSSPLLSMDTPSTVASVPVPRNQIPYTGAWWDNYGDGMIFICSKDTYREAMELKVLGLPRAHLHNVTSLRPYQSSIFLFNFADRLLYGVFHATSSGVENRNPRAWSRTRSPSSSSLPSPSPYPAYIEFTSAIEYEPLAESAFRHIFTDCTRTRRLDSRQVRDIIHVFRTQSKPISRAPTSSLSTSRNNNSDNEDTMQGKTASLPPASALPPIPSFSSSSSSSTAVSSVDSTVPVSSSSSSVVASIVPSFGLSSSLSSSSQVPSTPLSASSLRHSTAGMSVISPASLSALPRGLLSPVSPSPMINSIGGNEGHSSDNSNAHQWSSNGVMNMTNVENEYNGQVNSGQVMDHHIIDDVLIREMNSHHGSHANNLNTNGNNGYGVTPNQMSLGGPHQRLSFNQNGPLLPLPHITPHVNQANVNGITNGHLPPSHVANAMNMNHMVGVDASEVGAYGSSLAHGVNSNRMPPYHPHQHHGAPQIHATSMSHRGGPPLSDFDMSGMDHDAAAAAYDAHMAQQHHAAQQAAAAAAHARYLASTSSGGPLAYHGHPHHHPHAHAVHTGGSHQSGPPMHVMAVHGHAHAHGHSHTAHMPPLPPPQHALVAAATAGGGGGGGGGAFAHSHPLPSMSIPPTHVSDGEYGDDAYHMAYRNGAPPHPHANIGGMRPPSNGSGMTDISMRHRDVMPQQRRHHPSPLAPEFIPSASTTPIPGIASVNNGNVGSMLNGISRSQSSSMKSITQMRSERNDGGNGMSMNGNGRLNSASPPPQSPSKPKNVSYIIYLFIFS
jgi:hypothetical protein